MIDNLKILISIGICSKLQIIFLLHLLILLVVGIEYSEGQSISVHGIITDQANDQPLIGANVTIEHITEQEIKRGSSADRNGFYGISGLKSGRYIFRVSHIGYETHRDTISLVENSRVTMNIAMIQDHELLDEVRVSPTSGAIRRTSGEQRIRSTDIARIPTPAGVGDLASYLQALPGVVSASDRGGQLFIRGGTPSQNMVLMDGTIIYQPFHIIGFYSAFPEKIVSSVDFFPGGFGSRFNSRISSVLDVRLKDGDRNQYHGSASVSPFLGEVYLEGPIKSGVSSWIVSGRQSLIEHTSPWFLSEQQPLKFESQYFKFSHKNNENSICSAMMMRTFDQGRLDFESDDVVHWNNFILGGKCVMLPAGSTSLFELNMGISRMSNSAGKKDNPELTSGITRINLDFNITRHVRNIRLEYGGFIHLKLFSYSLRELFQDPRIESDEILGSGLHMETTYEIGEWSRIRSGAVFSLYPDVYSPSLEPRLRFTWNPFRRDDEEISAAIGLYRQALVGLNDIRDVSSVFVAWMPSPDDGPQMEAWHALLGWRQSLGDDLNLSFEGYYKRLRNLPITVWSTLARLNTNLAKADGLVYGSDVRLEFSRGRIYGFAGYSYTWTQYESAQDHFTIWFGEPVQRFHPPHDRRHQVNSMLSAIIGQYRVGIRWELGTGLPFTQPMGFDELIRYDERIYDVRDMYGNPRMILEKPYQGRLPIYHRLDLSLERSISFPGVQLDLQIGAINLYNQKNLFYYDIYTQRQINQLPFAPYFSIKLENR